MKTLTNIERFDKALKNNSFTMDEELYFINALVAKYNFISKREYADKEGVSVSGVMSRLKAKNDPYIILCGKVMIVE